MAGIHNAYEVVAINENETQVLNENFDRKLLYFKNRGDESIFIGNEASFVIATSSLELKSGESQWWTNDNCPANSFYAKCSSGLSSSLEMEEV